MNADPSRKSDSKKMVASHVRRPIWLAFHAWTVGAILLLFAGNVATALRPFENSSEHADSASRAPLITISSSSSRNAVDQRKPASSNMQSERSDYLVDVQLDCAASKTLALAKEVRQIRLRIADCRAGNRSLETFYIRNETNGFEATVFKVPDARKPASMDLISTDYISLESGQNKIRISRSQGDSPSREQTLEVRRN